MNDGELTEIGGLRELLCIANNVSQRHYLEKLQSIGKRRSRIYTACLLAFWAHHEVKENRSVLGRISASQSSFLALP